VSLDFLQGALPVWLVVVVMVLVVIRQEGHRGALGFATQLTLFRGVLLGGLAGSALLVREAADPGWVAWLPGSLYTAAALIDLVDGYVARLRGEETPLGARLDVALDALGLVVGPLAAIALGRLPAFYLVVGAVYYLFHGGLWLRRRLGWPVYLERLRPSRYTRMYAGYQMGLVATVLFPVVEQPGASIAAAAFMVPNLTLFSRDWLVTTGRLNNDAPAYLAGLTRFEAIVQVVMPFVRIAAAAGIVALVWSGHLPRLLLAHALLIVLGVTPRLVAFAAAIFLTLVLRGDSPSLVLATYLATLVTLLAGGGRASLWPEDRWLLRRAGEGRRGSVD
jgi:CDP-diacylglycerol--glycerol-3-phosphate 3-phosphatidyltransferase